MQTFRRRYKQMLRPIFVGRNIVLARCNGYLTVYCLLTPRFEARMKATKRSRSGDCDT